MNVAYTNAASMEEVKRQLKKKAALSSGCEYSERHILGAEPVGLLSTMRGDGYSVYHCIVKVEADKGREEKEQRKSSYRR